MSADPIAVIGGGPVGLTLALLLARRHVPAVVVDARSVDDAKRDRRLLALSRGTLDTLGAVVELPPAALAPIRSVVVSSRGEFGRAVLDEHENGGKALGATVRYGDLLTALAAACVAHPLVTVRRPCAMSPMRQTASAVEPVLPDGETLMASLAVNAEGTGASGTAPVARQTALDRGYGSRRPDGRHGVRTLHARRPACAVAAARSGLGYRTHDVARLVHAVRNRRPARTSAGC